MEMNRNRELWLSKAIRIFKSGMFKRAHLKIPLVKVSVGLPYGTR